MNQYSSIILNLFLFILIHANEQFHFGIINHNTQWYFHCSQTNTKLLNPPSDDQPLISYECPYPSSTIEILPIEIDFTFLCRLQSRLIWIIIDLYQYNTYLWLLNMNDIEIKIELNNEILITNFRNEIKNYTNHFIIINAFYIPFESINILLDKQIEINILIKNLKQLNQCQFILKDNYLWKTFINENNCNSIQSKTISVHDAKCDFYSNKQKAIETDLQVQIVDHIIMTTTSTSIPDFQIILSINEQQPPPLPATTTVTKYSRSKKPIYRKSTTTTTQYYSSEKTLDHKSTTTTITQYYSSEKSLDHKSTTNSIPHYHHYLFLESSYRHILSSLSRLTMNSKLLKLTLIFLCIILILLGIFFLYMLCYHHRLRLRRSSTLIQQNL